MFWWIWIVFGVCLLILELALPTGFFLLFSGVSAVLVGLMVKLDLLSQYWTQWLAFTAISFAAILLFRKKMLMRNEHKSTSYNDNMIGEVAVALEDIASQNTGTVEFMGSSWKAKNDSAQVIQRGQACIILRVNGLVLEVSAK